METMTGDIKHAQGQLEDCAKDAVKMPAWAKVGAQVFSAGRGQKGVWYTILAVNADNVVVRNDWNPDEQPGQMSVAQIAKMPWRSADDRVRAEQLSPLYVPAAVLDEARPIRAGHKPD